MAWLNDIRTGAKTAIAANGTFTTAAIYKREELREEQWDRALINVFMEAMEPRTNRQPNGVVLKIFPIRFVVAWHVDGRSNAPSATDTITENKSTYNDALITALATMKPGGAYTASGVYDAAWASSNLSYKETIEHEDIMGRDYRIAQTWEFHTYES